MLQCDGENKLTKILKGIAQSEMLSDLDENALAPIDYHQLREYVSGRRMIYSLIIFISFCVITCIIIIAMFLLNAETLNDKGLVAVMSLAFMVLLFVIAIIGAYNSRVRGFWLGIAISILHLFVFPTRSIIRGFASRCLCFTKIIYKKQECNFKKLQHACKLYTVGFEK